MQEDPDQLLEAALAGDPLPLVTVFSGLGPLAVPLMHKLLAAPQDAPIAACFARIWEEIGPGIPDGRAQFLRWYLTAEVNVPHPLRATVHRDALTRLLFLDRLPESNIGYELVFGAVRAAANEPSPLGLHARAHTVLERAARAWMADPARPIPQSLIYAAIATLNLGVMRDGMARAETQERDAELDRAIDWAMAALLDNQGGVDDAMAAMIRREFQRDPGNPAAVQRYVLLAQREGQRFSDLVHLFHEMRPDASDPHLRGALFYCYAQAREHELVADETRLRPACAR